MESIETILGNVFDKPLRKLTERQRDIAFYYIKDWAKLTGKQRKAKASDADKVRATKERIKAERRARHTRPLTETEQAEYAAAWDYWQEVDKDTPTSQSDPAPAATPRAPGVTDSEWESKARTRASEIVKESRERDLYPSQMDIADRVAAEFRKAGIVGTDGKPISGAYIKRHALKGISSAVGKKLSTTIGRGK